MIGTRTRRGNARTPIQIAAARATRPLTARALLESLENRTLLAATDPIISEFMADNTLGLNDGNNVKSDWIEIYNPSTSPIDLAGWHLTDNASDPNQFTFPSFTVPAGGYKILFASSKLAQPYVDPSGYVHTNFSLNKGGEYLALSKLDGTITSSYAPEYPEQASNVSYGFGPSSGGAVTTLLNTGAPGTSFTPTNAGLGITWTGPAFNDSGWQTVTTGVGFETTALAVPVLTQENEGSTGNNDLAHANDARTSLVSYSGNLYQLGFTGAIGAASDVDYFNLGAFQNGDVITITTTGTGAAPLVDPLIQLYRSNGTVVATSDDNNGPGNDSVIHRFTITTNETYHLRISSNAGSTGTYRVGIRLENTGTAPTTSTTLTAETESNNTVATANNLASAWRAVNYRSHLEGAGQNFGASEDWFKYQFNAGDVVTVYIDSTSSADAMSVLRDSAGNALASEDGSSANPSPFDLDSAIYSYVIPTTGIYYVVGAKLGASPTGTYAADVYLSTTATPPHAANFSGQYTSDVSAGAYGVNASTYLRVPFAVANPANLSTLTLKMKYDDGFVAYLNGTEVARRNAPGVAGTPLSFNAAATIDRSTGQAIVYEDIDISAFRNLLTPGSGNVLAIQGLNSSASSDDFLLVPQITGSVSTSGTKQYFYTPTPGAANITGAGVVINEIHYDPDVKTQRVDFVELYNNASTPVNISNWTFTNGIQYTFGPSVTINPGQYIVLTENSAQFQSKFGLAAFGQYIGSLSGDGDHITLKTGTGDLVDDVTYGAGFPWPTVGDPLTASAGSGGSIQLINAGLDNNLGGNWRSALPTPGAQNSVTASNAAPAIRQVDQGPTQPVANQPVTITAKVTDPDGISSVNLLYQVNAPGAYVPYLIANPGSNNSTPNPAYNTGWVTVAMYDDGTHGDATPGDGTYSAQISPAINQNRTLLRYKVTATDAIGASITAPYADDPQLNFAYYVYSGIPSWTASAHPGVTPNATYSSDVLNSLPVYTLITTKQDHANALSVPVGTVNPNTGSYGGEEYLWAGTLVYDGKVYDNIRWRARGGVWRYAMGKNMWKIDFNRNHYFEYRDPLTGKKADVPWKKLNLGAVIQQGDFQQRGEQGLFEYAGFKLFNLAGAPGPVSSPATVRIVEDASETGPTSSQYDDDFQGLYLAIEQQDGQLLESHGLPDGNLYKMESGAGGGTSNNQGPTQPTGNADLVAFTNTYKSGAQTEQWWRDNVDLPAYFAYRAVVDAIHHYDIGFGKNYFFYHNPVTNKWQQIAWDLDLTWTSTYAPGNGDTDPWKAAGILNIPAIATEYKNFLRSFRDLLWNPEQLGQLLDEYSSLVNAPGGPSIVDADRAMWDYNPIMVSGYVNSSKAAQGRYYQSASPTTFAGFVQKLKSYVSTRGTFLDGLDADALIPNKPTITYTGNAAKPLDGLTFHSSNFSSGNSTFGAMRWRIAEVYDATNPIYNGVKAKPYEYSAIWQSDDLASFNPDVTVPSTGLIPGHTYRVRVQMKDANGRWSNWSNAVQFVAGQAGASVVNDLRISEIMYNPAPAPTGSGFTDDDFEYVELVNRGASTLDLTGVNFTNGVDFTFPNGFMLAAGARTLVVKNLAAFQSRYGHAFDAAIAGTYTLKTLSNSGDTIRLAGANGQTILDFSYADDWYPQTDGDGYSLVIVNPDAPAASWGLKESWRASTNLNGDPTTDVPGLTANAVVINEILANPASPNQSWIELRNTTNAPIDLSNWFLSDTNADLKRFQLPDGTILPANGYLVLNEQDGYGGAGAASPFSLRAIGGTIYLTQGNAAQNLLGYREIQDYESSDSGVTIGRYVKSTGKQDFTAMAAATPGAANANPKIGPIIITEVMFNPGPGATEYVEFRNTTDAPLDLSGWTLDGASFTFPAGTIVAPHGYFLVVPIDPAAYRSTYGVPASTQIFGPFAGILDDSGEPLAIRKPTPGSGVSGVPVDYVTYEAALPWPAAAANGSGAALVRKDQNGYANDVVNWAASATNGSPGKPNFAAGVTAVYYWTLAIPTLKLTFTEDVSATLTANKLAIQNLSGGAVPATTYSWDPDTLTATWTLAEIPDDGNYRATLTAAGVTDVGGLVLDGDANGTPGGNFTQDFFYLAGDANHDRNVDFNDLVPLAQNYNTSGANLTYAQGDFNGDGAVDFNDLVILAQHYNGNLPAGAAAISAGAGVPVTQFASIYGSTPIPPTTLPTKPAKPAPVVVTPPKVTKKPEPPKKIVPVLPPVVKKTHVKPTTFSKAKIR